MKRFRPDLALGVPLADQIAGHFRQRILSGELPPGRKLPPLAEQARTLSVGMGTVRRALDRLAREGLISKRPRIGTVVKPRPRAAGAASFLSPEQRERLKGLRVGVVGGEAIFADYDGCRRQSEIVGVFEATIASYRGTCEVTALTGGESAAELRSRLRGVDGIFYLHSFEFGDAVLGELLRLGTPLVGCDYWGPLKISSVRDDWDWATREAMRYLLELGHRRIALASYSYVAGKGLATGAAPRAGFFPWAAEREKAFLDVSRRRGLPLGEKDIFRGVHRFGEPSDPALVELGRKLASRMLGGRRGPVGSTRPSGRRGPVGSTRSSGRRGPVGSTRSSGRRGRVGSAKPFGGGYTAVVAVNDYVALGVLERAAKMGLEAPRDFSVIGFDNLPPAARSGLTTVMPLADADGRGAAEMLARLYLHPSRDSLVQATNRPMLIVRRTTGPAGAAPVSKSG